MAHKKGVGSTRNGRDSNPQYRGVKKFGGEQVTAGSIIIRQCGTQYHPGRNVGLGSDFDGISCAPQGIDSAADLPKITEALYQRGYKPADIQKILGGNLLRVFRQVTEKPRLAGR